MEAADVQWEQAASSLGFACAGALATHNDDATERLRLATLLAFGLLEVGRTGGTAGCGRRRCNDSGRLNHCGPKC